MTLKCPVTVFRPIRIRKLNVGVESGYMLHMQFVCRCCSLWRYEYDTFKSDQSDSSCDDITLWNILAQLCGETG
jgi:hypothetical protein